MRVRRALALLTILIVALPSASRADVMDYLGKPVVSVAILSEGRPVTDARLLALIDTAAGRPLSANEVRESITHLFSFGVYDDVRARASLVEGGVALVYELVPQRPVEDIVFNGAQGPGLDAGRLREMLEERFGRSPRVSRVADMTADVEQALRDVGYLRPRVTTRVDARPDEGGSALVFTLEPGLRSHISAVLVEGNPGIPVPAFEQQLGIAAGDPFVRETINARMERYLADQRRKGYYEARLTVSPRLDEGEQTVTLVFTVQQGPLVRVLFEGDPVPADRRDELVPITTEGSADEDLLEDSTNRIVEFFRAQGYRDAAAPFSRETRDSELLITFTVSRGPLYRVGSIDLTGNASIPADQLAPRLRVRPGQPFSGAALDADLTQIEETYRQLGFASARTEAFTEMLAPAADLHVPVAIRIEVAENARTTVNSVQVEGNTSVPIETLTAGLSLGPGEPFSAARLALDRDTLELHYANLGFQSASVEGRVSLSADSQVAEVLFAVREGPRIFVDHVLIVGNDRTRTETIERELQFKTGDPLGLEAISESQRRLAALGLFRRARITQLGRADQTRRDVLVSVDEAPLTTIGYGGGLEVRRRIVRAEDDPRFASERIEFAPRATFEIGRRNLFGKNRSVNLFTSGSLNNRNSVVFANQPGPPEASTDWGFPQYRVVGQFRQPRIRGSSADFRVTGVLEQQIRSSFNFTRRSANAELAMRLSPRVSVSGGYQIQRNRVFNLATQSPQSAIDRLFPTVRLSSFLGSIIRDTRDDPVDPTFGQYVSANGQIAAKVIGSEVSYVKTFVTAQSFRTLPGGRGIVFATSARVGAAVGFRNAAGVRDLPSSERFFAGGDTTVRGFTLDRLGVRHVPPESSDTVDLGGFPLGGNGLVIFNGELRVPIRAGVRIVGFADVGQVYKTVSDVRVRELRPALGFGFRYKSPVGPLRFDLGIKVPRRYEEARTAWFITFGEAF